MKKFLIMILMLGLISCGKEGIKLPTGGEGTGGTPAKKPVEEEIIQVVDKAYNETSLDINNIFIIRNNVNYEQNKNWGYIKDLDGNVFSYELNTKVDKDFKILKELENATIKYEWTLEPISDNIRNIGNQATKNRKDNAEITSNLLDKTEGEYEWLYFYNKETKEAYIMAGGKNHKFGASTGYEGWLMKYVRETDSDKIFLPDHMWDEYYTEEFNRIKINKLDFSDYKLNTDEIVIVYHFTNYAWGYANAGVCIDRNGRVFNFEIPEGTQTNSLHEYIKQYNEFEYDPLASSTIEIEDVEKVYNAGMKIDVKSTYETESVAMDAGISNYYFYNNEKDYLLDIATSGDCAGKLNDKEVNEILEILMRWGMYYPF